MDDQPWKVELPVREFVRASIYSDAGHIEVESNDPGCILTLVSDEGEDSEEVCLIELELDQARELVTALQKIIARDERRIASRKLLLSGETPSEHPANTEASQVPGV